MKLSKEFHEKFRKIVKLSSGQEVLIRLAQEDDLEKVWNGYKNQPDNFYQFITRITKELVDIWYEEIDHSKTIPINAFIWSNENEGIYLGNCTLMFLERDNQKQVTQWGISVLTEVQNQGLGSQLLNIALEVAQNMPHLRRFELEVVEANQIAINLYLKHGFKIEGRFKQRWQLNGKYFDTHMMAKLINQKEK